MAVVCQLTSRLLEEMSSSRTRGGRQTQLEVQSGLRETGAELSLCLRTSGSRAWAHQVAFPSACASTAAAEEPDPGGRAGTRGMTVGHLSIH